MTLTPRQMAAYLEFVGKLDRMEQASDLTIAYIGAQGDKKSIDKALKELGAI